ncbi:MAG: BatA and WFA domain-containing protein [Melioribacter sp.]|nr:BatA and WFA domain-containing protein [Melioribacter sp.]
MTFLNPAILFGLFAASIPIILHFFNLRKLKKIEFSTLQFLKELQKSKIRRIKIKQWLLLLLRVLIIVFLVFAFARPTIKVISFSADSKTTAVFIIDNTFSMSVVTSSGSYLSRSKQIAKNLVGNFNVNDEIAVLPLVVNDNYELKAYSNFEDVKKIIDEIEISYQTKTINEALFKAANFVYQSKNFNKEIYIFTDLQKGRIYNNKGELINLSRLLKDVRLYLIDIHSKEITNIGIEDFKVNNQIFEKNKTVSFSVEVKNYSNVNVENKLISLFVNERKTAQQSISLNPHELKTLSLETTLSDTGLITTYVELEDDGINYDNIRYTAFYIPSVVRILILADNLIDTKYVKLALLNSGIEMFRITEKDLSYYSSISLDNYDVVIVIGADKINEPEKLKRYVINGGGVVLFPGSKSSLSSLQNLSRVLEIDGPQSFSGKQNSNEFFNQFSFVDLKHPLFEDLFEEINKTKIESPEIYYYLKNKPSHNSRTIISLYDNSAFLSEYKLDKGKVLFFNVAPVLDWSNFPLKSLFAPIVNKIVFYLSSKTKSQNKLYAGDQLVVNLQSAKTNLIKIVNPDNSETIVNTDSLINKNFLNYTRTHVIGIYKFYSNNNLIDFFAVNCDPKESISEYDSIENFEKYLKDIGYNENIISLKPGDNYTKIIYQSRYGIELWKHFLVLAFVLALFEMFLAKSSKKDITEN